MTDTFIELTEEAFDAQFKLRTNHYNPNAGWVCGEGDGCLFETDGEELALVCQQNPRTVWTLIDGDDGDHYLLSGFHLVNRIGYLISTSPVPEGTTIKVRIPMQSEEDGEAIAHTPEPWRIHRLNNGWPVITSVAHDIADLRLNGKGLSHVEANARRICAAINACKGISTEALDQGVITEMLKALREVMYHASRFDEEGDLQPITMKTLGVVRRALAKAKGRAV